MRLSSRSKKIIVNQILLFKLLYIGQMFTIPKYMEKEIEKICDFLWKGKTWPPRYLAKLSILRGGLGILDIETQLNSLKLIWIQGLLNATNSLWNNPTLYQLDLILSFNQGLFLFRQKQIFRSNRHKNLQKQNNEDFFSQLLIVWLYFTNNNLPTLMSIGEILHQHQTGLLALKTLYFYFLL